MTEIENLTPPHLRCQHPLRFCPSLHKLPDGRLLVVGKGDMEAWSACNARVIKLAVYDRVVIIDPSLLDTFVAEKVKEERERCAKIAADHLASVLDHHDFARGYANAAIRIGQDIKFNQSSPGVDNED